MVESERIILIPLTYSQLEKYIRNDNSLEEELNLNPTSRTISPELKEALENTILPNVADINKNYLYSTLWTIISKPDNKMVGDICIIGEPNTYGEIEIGYGTYEEFQGKGFMTEAVGCILK
jgi:[ribosomal protein S5]-alanine N-acetyltransferase